MKDTLVIALAVMLPLIAIVILLVRQSRKQEQKSKRKLDDLYLQIVTQNQLSITYKQETGNKIFALDTAKKTLVYIWYYGELMYDIIDLAIIDSCTVKKTGAGETRKGQHLPDAAINRISLSLSSLGVEVFDLLVYSELNDGVPEKAALRKSAAEWEQAVRDVLKDR